MNSVSDADLSDSRYRQDRTAEAAAGRPHQSWPDYLASLAGL